NPPFPLLQIRLPNMPILPQKVHKCIVIYLKDVENITGGKLPQQGNYWNRSERNTVSRKISL
ncbi:MAG TPA: hypothetical protein VLI68_01935, partial [Hanamia sp.]|nr:hypothetical protein [Hanamia sp.]